ncbi:MAG TPA: Na/Pi cotransporter [Marinobacter sp.]|nr:Na/Pi cotransporter [Marinobacter sp.]
MTFDVLFQVAGGLALFMLAMEMMTNGLKQTAGPQLRHILANWTRTPIRGVGSGMLITGIVQHSGAVTVATIGFVNAGLMTLTQALTVVFGANVGTTMTGWLVSLVGFGVNIEAFALPLLAAGVGLRLASSHHRRKAMGETITGFALFFLGLSILKSALDGFTEGSALSGADYGLPAWLLIGFLGTVVTQSSSAALAIVLTAASGGLITLDNAAAAVIGANLGSTSTAALSVIKATSNARRLAVGHILFNVVTGLIALSILPVMLWSVDRLTGWLELEANAAISLAIFHTLFNVLGVLLMLPLAGHMARLLGRLFRSAEEDNARPRYLDHTLLDTPELALEATDREITRFFALVESLLRAALDRQNLKPADMAKRTESARTLFYAITDYITRLRSTGMAPDIVETLTTSVRTCRYLNEVLALNHHILAVRDQSAQLPDPLAGLIQDYLDLIRSTTNSGALLESLGEECEKRYQSIKAQTLRMMVRQQVSAQQGEALLDTLSSLRRLTDQWLKALMHLPTSETRNSYRNSA